jgi:hypothetical protein
MRSLCTLLAAAACLAPTVAAQDSRSVERQHVTALRQMIATVNAGDAAGYAKLYADTATITIYGGEKISGREAIEKYEVGLMRQYPGTRLAFSEVWQLAPMAIVHYGVNGKAGGGAAMGHEGLLFFRFGRSGLIAEERRYLDSATPMAQLGAFGKVETRSLPQLPRDLATYSVQSPAGNDPNVPVVRLALQAIESNNVGAFMRQAAPSIIVDDLMLPAPFNGNDISRWFATWSNVEPGPYHRVTNTFAGSDYVILETAMSGWLKGPIGRLSASPKPFTVHAAWIAQLQDRKIVKLTRFLNSKELADATGQQLAGQR